jgi:hypothetical protein
MPRHLSLAPTAASFALVLALVLSVPTPAAAGIGNPIKKAKEALGKEEHKESQAKPCQQVVFDDVTIELTEARVARLVASFQKVEAILSPRPGLVEQRNKANDERGAIWDKHGTRSQAQNKRDEVMVATKAATKRPRTRNCRSTPSTRSATSSKYKNLAMKDNAAAAQATRRRRQSTRASWRMLPRCEDSAQVRKSAGPIPPQTKEEDQSPRSQADGLPH